MPFQVAEARVIRLRAAVYAAMSYLRSPLARVAEGDSAHTMLLLNSAVTLSRHWSGRRASPARVPRIRPSRSGTGSSG